LEETELPYDAPFVHNDMKHNQQHSVYEMLQRLIELKVFCLRSQDVPGFSHLKVSLEKWEAITNLCEILKLPAELTKQLQSEDLLVPDFVYHWFSMMTNLKMLVSPMAKSLHRCLQAKEEEIFENHVILAGWFLDKSLSLLPEMNRDERKKRKAKDIIRTVSKKKNLLLGVVETFDIVPEMIAEEPVANDGNPFDLMLKNLGKESEKKANSQTSQPSDALEEELKKYEASYAPIPRQNAMTWWKNRSTDFPILSAIAFDIISVPVTEVTVERLFSHLKIVVNRHRSLLKGDLINDILFLRMNEKFDQ
jgi:hypothetical protein